MSDSPATSPLPGSSYSDRLRARLRGWMELTGTTQHQLAAEAGQSRPNVAGKMQGSRVLTVDDAEAMCRAMNLKPDTALSRPVMTQSRMAILRRIDEDRPLPYGSKRRLEDLEAEGIIEQAAGIYRLTASGQQVLDDPPPMDVETIKASPWYQGLKAEK